MNSKTKYTKLQYLLEALCLAGLLFSVVYLLMTWPNLPATVPKYYLFGDASSDMVAKNTLLLLPVCNVVFYLFLTMYCFKEEKWRISVTVTKANHDAVYARYRDLMLTIKLLAVIVFGVVSWYDLNAINGMQFPMWMVFAFLLVFFGDIILMFMRVNKASEQKTLK